ncbi:hypothetical protein M407DRAFT_31288 [Tulasnella calospora MUT 4182]|uniref:Uncharacterized protein n=1 Tax=Tulasnella calospora MUT 4182 TaxID=1051891 RepID=A0A0C3PVP1_9AGAM|nr:hypothetical protein M407DRAFT_31288 [Tulasnella calospora MUT 4182]
MPLTTGGTPAGLVRGGLSSYPGDFNARYPWSSMHRHFRDPSLHLALLNSGGN